MRVRNAIDVSGTESTVAWANGISALAADHRWLYLVHFRIRRQLCSCHLSKEHVEHVRGAETPQMVPWCIRAGRLGFGTRVLCIEIFCWCALHVELLSQLGVISILYSCVCVCSLDFLSSG